LSKRTLCEVGSTAASTGTPCPLKLDVGCVREPILCRSEEDGGADEDEEEGEEEADEEDLLVPEAEVAPPRRFRAGFALAGFALRRLLPRNPSERLTRELAPCPSECPTNALEDECVTDGEEETTENPPVLGLRRARGADCGLPRRDRRVG